MTAAGIGSHNPAVEESDHPGRIRDSWSNVCVIEWIVEIIVRVTVWVIGISHVTYVNPSLRRTPVRVAKIFRSGEPHASHPAFRDIAVQIRPRPTNV